MSHIILINGASSAGKSTLARAFLDTVDVPFLHYSFDLFIDGGALPQAQIKAGVVDWQAIRPNVFAGFRATLAALLQAGNNLVVDYIIETQPEFDDLMGHLAPFDVYWVGLHCSLEELERREIARGNRRVGDAARDLMVVHTFTAYDLELQSEDGVEVNVARLLAAWHGR